MKSIMAKRVSNADRAKYALRASPGAHEQKDQTSIISNPEKDDYRRTLE
jgi:hypothetical protein